MAARTTIVLVKRFKYRDNDGEEFSNSYSFKSPPPGDDASWAQFSTDMIAREKDIFPPTVSFVAAYGYDSDNPDDFAVWSHDYTTPGPPPIGTGPARVNGFSGDQAAMVSWRTQSKNRRGKWIYLRKYLHAGELDAADHDSLSGTYHTVLQTYATALVSHWGGITARTGDYTVTAGVPSWYVTTRTLHRRGKRPPLPA